MHRTRMLLLALALSPLGCAQYLTIRAPGPIDRNVLEPGTERTKIAGTLGAPRTTQDHDAGMVVDIYTYTDGGKKNTALPKAGRIILYTAGDIFTLFLDQILWIPAEVLMNGTEYRAVVEYRERASDGEWVAASITETELEGKREERVLELEPAVASELLVPLPVPSIPGVGTCFAISPDGRLLTAAHLLGDARSTYAVLADGRVFPATLESQVAALDVALLRVDAETPRHLTLGDTGSLQVDQRAFTFGHAPDAPENAAATWIDGSIASLSGPDGDATYLAIRMPAESVSAGGPLVDERGHVVGILTATATLPAAVAAVPPTSGEPAPAAVSASTAASVSIPSPEHVEFAVNARFVSPFVGASAPLPAAVSFEEAVEQTRAAVCRVQPHAPVPEASAAATPTPEAPTTEAPTPTAPTTEAPN